MPHFWFRLYAEFASDPKVQILPEAMQRRLVMLMCEHCEGDGTVTSQERHRVFQWRISDEELAKTKALFIESGFIDENWNLLNWMKRQFQSDSSTTRTKQWRERQRTLRERHSDGDVTGGDGHSDGLDTDTDTDTELNPPTPQTNPGVAGKPVPEPTPSGVVFMRSPDKLPVEGENLVDLVAIGSPPGLAVELTPDTITTFQRTAIIEAAKREQRKRHVSRGEALNHMLHGVNRQRTSGVRLALFGTHFEHYFRDGKYNTDPKIFIGPAKAQPSAVKAPTKSLDAIAREDRARAMADIAKENMR